MSNLSVYEYHGALVVDSRLIAGRLGIEHETFMRTVKKYETKIEQRFGIIRFEIGEIKGRGQPEKYALLTEPQATALMTFSRNTEQVVECKLELVEAFEKAKQVIATVIPVQSEEIERLKIELAIAQANNSTVLTQERLLLANKAIGEMHGFDKLALMQGRPDAIVPITEVIRETVMVDTNLKPVATFDGMGITEISSKLGFGTTKKAINECRKWLQSVGVKDDDWRQEMTAHATAKLPRELMPKLKQLWAQRKGHRQLLIGE